MDENEKKTAEAPPEQPKPEDYSRYMGTLNRIYRRNDDPKRKRLGDGIGSLKKGQQPLRRSRAKKTAASSSWRAVPSCFWPSCTSSSFSENIKKMPPCSVELHGGIFYNTMLRRSRSGTSPQPR